MSDTTSVGERGAVLGERKREREREMTHLEGGMEGGVGREECQLSQDEEGENLDSLIISFPQSQQTARQTTMEFRDTAVVGDQTLNVSVERERD